MAMMDAGGPAFNWVKLDISRGPALPRESDKVIKLFKSLQMKFDAARTREDQAMLLEAIDSLRTSIEGRIDDLEKFYMQNDVDERAVLFEKQRLALRRLLQTDPHGANSSASFNAKPPAPPAMATPDAQSERREKMARVRDKLEHLPKMAAAGARLKKGVHQPKLAYSTNASPKKNFSRTLSNRRSTAVKAVAPIYSWEKGHKKEEKTKVEEEAKQLFGPVEFSIVLTEKEFFKFTSRRRGMAAAKRHKARFAKNEQKDSPFLQSTGPYVDPERVKNSIFRSPDKNKWMDEKGIRPYTHL